MNAAEETTKSEAHTLILRRTLLSYANTILIENNFHIFEALASTLPRARLESRPFEQMEIKLKKEKKKKTTCETTVILYVISVVRLVTMKD